MGSVGDHSGVVLCFLWGFCYGSGEVAALGLSYIYRGGYWVKRREVLVLALMYSLSVFVCLKGEVKINLVYMRQPYIFALYPNGVTAAQMILIHLV